MLGGFVYRIVNILVFGGFFIRKLSVDKEGVWSEFNFYAFVNNVISGEWAIKTRRFINDITQVAKEHRQQLERQKRNEEIMMFQRYSIKRGRRF